MKAHLPRKRFGQHFLVSPGIIRKIIAAIAPQPGDTVVEIGPGLGALTEPLLEHVDHLHVVEIDRDLIIRLRTRFPPERLTIHEGDALQFDFGSLKGEGPLKIVGNLPYNISSPLLFHLTRFADRIAEMHFMLQKEVVDRMVAEPGTGAYGRLSVMLQYRFYMERLFIVPPGAFDPAPKVDSAVVRMIPRKLGAGGTARDETLFSRLVTAAFSQRRKMLRNTLREFGGETLLAAQGIAPTARAEELSVADYVRLANALAAQ
ncbi:16S rRNA (adenine(1518)-N(6)/adenine(1519)-N(6))-dimethyltransferase RsmA [Sulfuricystis thermophila]|uniref:16S rRNA (adenine(1518)-N(6)/adenine(1519)-N(6))- dimethyltransferase RsmA n=1 Tax=Sulfuricystis thermophila TaxID=2496847 RepID=UPI00103674B5|nr:16S rRNA (adenine(1518)-N(6)/adenine(1519)-N(6))-dimethyltransferase RsmA [Sulfuricystis thermophila]